MSKIKSRTVEKDELFLMCSRCHKEIVGSTVSQLLYNLRTHIEAKHGKDNDLISFHLNCKLLYECKFIDYVNAIKKIVEAKHG